jgi:hypothetical protein
MSGCTYDMHTVHVDDVPMASMSRDCTLADAERMADIYRDINPHATVTVHTVTHSHTVKAGAQGGCPVCTHESTCPACGAVGTPLHDIHRQWCTLSWMRRRVRPFS